MRPREFGYTPLTLRRLLAAIQLLETPFRLFRAAVVAAAASFLVPAGCRCLPPPLHRWIMPTFQFTGDCVRRVSLEEVRSLCRNNQVDLVLASPSAPHVLCLHGEFDGYGDFFSIQVGELEYADVAGGCSVGDILALDSMAAVSSVVAKWRELECEYSGRALLIRSAYSASWVDAEEKDLFLVVANEFLSTAGSDWDAMSRSVPGR